MRKTKTIAFKLNVVKSFFRKFGKKVSETARHFVIKRNMVRYYISQRKLLRASRFKRHSRRVIVKNKRAKFEDSEIELFPWYKEQRHEKRSVTGKELRNKMIQLIASMHPGETFLASNGWLCNFLRRYRLTRRRVTTYGAPLPENSVDIIRRYLESLKNEIEYCDYSPDEIFNFGD